MARLRIAALISGRGSNLRALLDACAAADFPAQIVLVLSNVADAGGLRHAEAAGVATAIVDHRRFAGRSAFEHAMEAEIAATGAEAIFLAGFMRLLTPGFVDRWRDRLVNIHPSLLPAFPGLDTHARALASGVKVTGCTVHFVRAEMDHGPIIDQAKVAVLDADTPETLAARVLREEHRIYPLSLRLLAEGRIRVIDETTLITGVGRPDADLVGPPSIDPKVSRRAR